MTERTPVLFLDANILMYALGKPHLYREPCLKILAAIETDTIDVVTNAEVLQEFLYRYRAVATPEDAERVSSLARRLCEIVLPVRLKDVDLAVALLKRHPQSRFETPSTPPPCPTPASAASSRPIATSIPSTGFADRPHTLPAGDVRIAQVG